MQAKLKINNVAFEAWAESGGIEYSEDLRCVREIVTLDGNIRRAWITKHEIKFSAISLTDTTLNTLRSALATNPATVIYTDDNHHTLTGSFYIDDIAASAKSVVGNTTIYEGFSFTLREV